MYRLIGRIVATNMSCSVCGISSDETRTMFLTDSKDERGEDMLVCGDCIAQSMLDDEDEDDDQDICGICGRPGADKYALWTGGGLYWPGEFRPETELVHQECERAETARAHAMLTQEQRDAFLRGI